MRDNLRILQGEGDKQCCRAGAPSQAGCSGGGGRLDGFRRDGSAPLEVHRRDAGLIPEGEVGTCTGRTLAAGQRTAVNVPYVWRPASTGRG